MNVLVVNKFWGFSINPRLYNIFLSSLKNCELRIILKGNNMLVDTCLTLYTLTGLLAAVIAYSLAYAVNLGKL